ncbi:MAG: hypothetical protein O2973_10995 [Gemmatimonadetes bacterium]|nr:hypothetical protein [Gemmatimonadota bacterium]
MSATEVDRILEKVAKDVEAAVHALYRGEVRQATARSRTGAVLREVRAAMAAALSAAGSATGSATPSPDAARAAAPTGMPSARASAAAPIAAGSAAGWTREEGDAVMKCITGWLPMGAPTTADPASKCVSAMRELAPTWGQREAARGAVRRISQP